ncbi:MAG TPA: hypothetical protein PLU15_08205, partial [Bacillota bacterium]|nr:hypothetical protein [Bacillota bacterium]
MQQKETEFSVRLWTSYRLRIQTQAVKDGSNICCDLPGFESSVIMRVGAQRGGGMQHSLRRATT